MVAKWKKPKHKEGGAASRTSEGSEKRTFKNKRREGRNEEAAEIKSLEARIRAEAPKAGCGAFAPSLKGKDGAPAAAAPESSEGGPTLTTQLFKDLPISQQTLAALKQSNFVKMTEIQRGAIPHALAGRDVLGEARTGSGKTLAFLVPLIELLFRSRWTKYDGLGGLIVSPTRELAYQIFQVLVEIGAQHDLSAGCVVGGRDFEEESKTVAGMNLLVATPGRLLQHLDSSASFEATNLQMLVLDEADRILDFGFQETTNHILSHLPSERQTMLFSATLHSSVHRLGKMAMRSPEIISVHKDARNRTPDKLKQVYMIIQLEQKIDVLFSFLRTHSQKKMIVFVSSCKQVRFYYESFRQLKPGPAVMELHGRQSLTKRMLAFKSFSEKERAVVLFCTDIAARGVDFPAVDWVLQLDCPDTVESYTHRVGRTARFESAGSSALFLLPSEEAFVAKLKAHRIDVKSISAKQGKIQTIQSKVQAVISGDQSIKYLAQKALTSYVRSVHLMKDKEVFNVKSLPLENFANSMGLAAVPEGLEQLTEGTDADKNLLKLQKNKSSLQRLKDKIKAKKASAVAVDTAKPAPDADEDSESDARPKSAKKKLSRWERRQRQKEVLEKAPARPAEPDDDLLVPVSSHQEHETPAAPSTQKRKLKLGKDGVATKAEGKHTYFSDKGGSAASEFAQIGAEPIPKSASKESRQAFLNRVSGDLAQRDGDDFAVSRARIHDQHRKKRRLGKDERRTEEGGGGDSGEEGGIELGGRASASRSPSACPSSSDEGGFVPESYKQAKAARKKAPAKERSTAIPAKIQKIDAPDGGEKIQASDDLDTLEKQVLNKLSGLF